MSDKQTAIEKINSHSFGSTYVTGWYYYNDGAAGLNLSGDFNQEEINQTGLRHYKIYFCQLFDDVSDGIGNDYENISLNDIDVTQEGDGYSVILEISDERKHRIQFRCKRIYCSLLRYLGLSYKNVYGTKAYERLFQRAQTVKKDAYLQEHKSYELPQEYSLEVKMYSDMEQKSGKHMNAKRFLKHYILKHRQELVYEYDAIEGHHHPYTEFILHRNGHQYYPFHIDLYGISFLDLDTLETYHYVPQGYDNEYGGVCGESFIITDIHYDAATNFIAYGGCYWAAPCNVMVGDFSEPLQFNPKLVDIHEMLDPEYDQFDDVDFVRWEEDKLVVQIDSAREEKILIQDIWDKI